MDTVNHSNIFADGGEVAKPSMPPKIAIELAQRVKIQLSRCGPEIFNPDLYKPNLKLNYIASKNSKHLQKQRDSVLSGQMRTSIQKVAQMKKSKAENLEKFRQ